MERQGQTGQRGPPLEVDHFDRKIPRGPKRSIYPYIETLNTRLKNFFKFINEYYAFVQWRYFTTTTRILLFLFFFPFIYIFLNLEIPARSKALICTR